MDVRYLFLILAFTCSVLVHGGEESPMRFTENKGQWSEGAAFRSNLTFGFIDFHEDAIVYIFHDAFDQGHNHEYEDGHHHVHDDDSTGLQVRQGHHVQMQWEGSSSSTIIKPERADEGVYNYFLGDDPALWATDVKRYGKLHYYNLYDGIDVEVEGVGQNMKYTYTVAAGSDPSAIIEVYKGVENLAIEQGKLVYETSVADVTEFAPVAWQIIQGKRVDVPCKYKLNKRNGQVTYEFPNGYDAAYSLVIDPTVVFSSYSGSTQDNFGYTATFDDAGHLYGGGIALNPSPGQSYPTVGAFDATFNGVDPSGTFTFGFGSDMAISKFSPDGSSLVYSTYLGGSHNDQPHSLFVDDGELIIYGRSYSTNYPTTSGAFQQSKANPGNVNSDIVITKFNTAGNGLVGSTFFGGANDDGVNISPQPGASSNRTLKFNYADDGRGEVIADSLGRIFISSFTRSSDIFRVAGSFQSNLLGNQDALVASFNSDLSNLIWGSYLGGTRNDAGYGIKIDPTGHIVVAGGTNSSNFPGTSGGLNPSFGGGRADGFVARIAPDGSSLVQSSYIGTSNYDQAFFVEIDEGGNVFLYGQSEGGNYPVSAGRFSNPGSSQFIHKLDNSLTSSQWSTVFGSGSSAVNLSPTAFLVDVCGRIYISGWGGNTNNDFNASTGSTAGLPTQRSDPSDFLDNTTDGSDFYFMVLERDATDLLYATYFGGPGTSGEHVDGGTSRFDFRGTIYQAVCAGCGGTNAFPAINGGAGLVSSTNNSNNCNLGVLKMDIGLPFTLVNVNAAPRATGCVPLTVQFNGSYLNVTDFEWDFDDGSTSTLADPVHTFTDVGIYNVTLIGIDSNTCNGADTAEIQIIVEDDSLTASFTDDLVVDCEIRRVTASLPTNYPTTQHTWLTGDGNSYINVPLDHTYASPGTYTITLLVEDDNSCELADTATFDVVIPPLILGSAATPDTLGCIPFTANFASNISGSPDVVLWDFGDGNTSTDINPIHTYVDSGTYDVQLIVIDSNSCNFGDTSVVRVKVLDGFVDAMLDATGTYFNCDSVQINAWSSYPGATSYTWDLDNGTFSSDSSITVMYTDTGTYFIELIVLDTLAVCKPLDTAILDVTLNNLFTRIVADDTVGCIPFTVTLDVRGNAIPDSVSWDLGDGNVISGFPITYTYTDTGKYNIVMTAFEQFACTAIDIDSFRVIARDDRVIADFDATILEQCDTTLRIALTQQSDHFMRVDWFFDDSLATTVDPGEVVFRELGDHRILLVAYNDTACHPIDSMEMNFTLRPNAFAGFTADSVCTNTLLTLENLSNPAAQHLWFTDDGRSVSGFEPAISYPAPGLYNLTLQVTDTLTCDTIAVDSQVVEVYRTPIASFDVDTSYYYYTDPVQFTNFSTDYNSLFWDFDDGNTIRDEERPIHVFEGVGDFTPCLVASFPFAGCIDTFCMPINIDFDALLGVPNAFSPNGDGVNDRLFVEGLGITELDFQIYNRWGQLIYRSFDQAEGWDGTFNGTPQEVEVYIYTVEATFIDGSSKEIKGNVTLLR